MCRWIAYSGPPIHLDRLLFRPEHSLVDQSLHAQRSLLQVNADGFGIGWYGARSTPGLFRDVTPAWHDENLHSLAAHVSSHLFLAHVRASSGSPVQRTNCHPFRYRNWLFQHNGQIEQFTEVRRVLDLAVSPVLYPHMLGTTDSERLFWLAMSAGLQTSPLDGLRQAVQQVEAACRSAGLLSGLVMTAALADGETLYAVRYSSAGVSPSLFIANNPHALREAHGHGREPLPDGAHVIVSEPLDDLSEHWEAIPEGAAITVRSGRMEQTTFRNW